MRPSHLLSLSLAGCATVTQQDPPSQLDPAGVRTNLPANPGTRTPPVAEVSNGGSPGTALPDVDAGPEFPSGTLLLQENFENFSASAGAWASSQGSTWDVQTDPTLVSNVYIQSETTSSSPDLATTGDVTWRDVVVEADMEILAFNGSSSSYMAGLCVRVRDAQNFYLIGVRSNDHKVGLRRYASGGTNLVQSDFDQGTTGRWYHLRVEAIGSTITAFLDDTLMFSESDTTHASGGVALCTVRATASFDNLRVTAP
jgi:pectate lyase